MRIGDLAGGDTKDKRGKRYTLVAKARKRTKYGNAHFLGDIVGGGVSATKRAETGTAVTDDLRPEAA